MRKTLVAVVALTALAGAACSSGGDDNGGSTGATGATGATSAAGCTADNATDLTGDDPFVVTIQDLAFSPDCFAAASASSITIENKDCVTHTFTIDGTQVDVSIDGGRDVQRRVRGPRPGHVPVPLQDPLVHDGDRDRLVAEGYRPSRSERARIALPFLQDLHAEVQEHARAQERLHLHARGGPDRLQRLAAVADQDALLRVALHDQRRVDLREVALAFHLVDDHGDRMRHLLAGDP